MSGGWLFLDNPQIFFNSRYMAGVSLTTATIVQLSESARGYARIAEVPTSFLDWIEAPGVASRYIAERRNPLGPEYALQPRDRPRKKSSRKERSRVRVFFSSNLSNRGPKAQGLAEACLRPYKVRFFTQCQVSDRHFKRFCYMRRSFRSNLRICAETKSGRLADNASLLGK